MGQGLLSTCKRQTVINVAVFGIYDGSCQGTLPNIQKAVDKVSVTIPSTGMVVEEVHFKYFDVTTWGIGSRGIIRPVAHHLYNITDALIVMVDPTDRESFHEWDVNQFQQLLEEETLQKVPMVVLIDTYDAPKAISSEEVAEGLQLDKVRCDRELEVFEISGLTRKNITNALLWIARVVRLKDIEEAVVLPVEKAVPPSLKKIYQLVGSTLKTVFKAGAKDEAVLPPTAKKELLSGQYRIYI